MKQTSAIHLLTGVGVLLGISLWGRQAGAGPVSINATMDYEEHHDETLGVTDRFRQTYQIRLTNDIELSDTLSVAPTVRVNQETDEQGEDTYSVEPQVGVLYQADMTYFSINSTYTFTGRQGSEEQDQRSSHAWDSVLSSNFESPWPRLELRVGGNLTDTEDRRTGDTSFATYTHDEEYDISIFDLSYEFSRNMNWDRLEDTLTTTDTHDGTVDAAKSFFGGALNLSLNHQVTFTSRSFNFDVGADGMIELPASISDGRAGRDTNPADTDEQDIVDRSDLISGGARIRISREDNINFGFDRGTGSLVNRIYLEVATDPGDDLVIGQGDLDDFSFEIWASNERSRSYTRVDAAPTVSPVEHAPDQFRFNIDTVAITRRFVKVVVTDQRTPAARTKAVYVTRARAAERRFVTADQVEEKTTTASFKTNFNVDAQPAENWQVTTGFSHTYERTDPGVMRTDLAQNSSVTWTPNRYFQPTLSLNQTLNKGDEQETTLNRHYTARVTSIPLSTLDLSVGSTLTETYREEIKDSQGHTYFFTVDSQVFPDLSASLNGLFSETTSIEDGSTSSSYDIDLTTNARLTPKITLDGSVGFSESDTAPINYRVNVSWRPSDVLSCTFDYAQEEETTYSIRPTWRLSRALQLSASYLHDEETDAWSLESKWLLGDIFSIDLDYQLDDEEWFWKARLTGNF